eukprot:1178885-Prorocentrum_minimum.AAC.5
MHVMVAFPLFSVATSHSTDTIPRILERSFLVPWHGRAICRGDMHTRGWSDPASKLLRKYIMLLLVLSDEFPRLPAYGRASTITGMPPYHWSPTFLPAAEKVSTQYFEKAPQICGVHKMDTKTGGTCDLLASR